MSVVVRITIILMPQPQSHASLLSWVQTHSTYLLLFVLVLVVWNLKVSFLYTGPFPSPVAVLVMELFAYNL